MPEPRKGSEVPTSGDQSIVPQKTDYLTAIRLTGGPGGTPLDYRDTVNNLVLKSDTHAAVVVNAADIDDIELDLANLVRLPAVSAVDSGKYLSVNGSGNWVVVSIPFGPFLGVFVDLDDLRAQHPTAPTGKYVAILENPSAPPSWAIWDSELLDWVEVDEPGNIAVNLGLANVTTTTLDVTSSAGSDITIPAATVSSAGLLTAADKAKIDSSAQVVDGALSNATVPASAIIIPDDDNILSPGPVIAWDVVTNGPIVTLNMTEDGDLPLMTGRTKPGTYAMRLKTNGFTLGLTAFEAPDGGAAPALSTGSEDTNALIFIDWGLDRVTVFNRGRVMPIS